MGMVMGSLVAGARARGLSTWADSDMAMVDIAEDLLAGTPVPIELDPISSIAAAIGLADASPPLLFDPATVSLIDLVREALRSGTLGEPADPTIAKVCELAKGRRFDDAVAAVGENVELATLTGAIVGLDGGLGAVPAKAVSTLRSTQGRRGRRYFCGLTNRLLGIERPTWYDPRSRRGPKEVLPGLWLANLYGLPRFTTAHPDGLVLSLCDDEGRIADHPHHITFHLDDTPRTDANPSLALVVDDVLAELRAARTAGRPVLVHCRHGASRTGLILRSLLVEEEALTAEDALVEAQCLWPHTSEWNTSWTEEVERRARR